MQHIAVLNHNIDKNAIISLILKTISRKVGKIFQICTYEITTFLNSLIAFWT